MHYYCCARLLHHVCESVGGLARGADIVNKQDLLTLEELCVEADVLQLVVALLPVLAQVEFTPGTRNRYVVVSVDGVAFGRA